MPNTDVFGVSLSLLDPLKKRVAVNPERKAKTTFAFSSLDNAFREE